MRSALTLLRDDLDLRQLLAEYKARKDRDKNAEWFDRVMALGDLDQRALSKLHGLLLAQGWIDTRIASDVFDEPGRLANCYRITSDGNRALTWVTDIAEDEPEMAEASAWD
ncbi:hypothetical protein Pan216_36270 [Planctomycetes bacterium Pan216]|uniref:Uncharacterized protein n=1 Tax=Kolteria novifilia TaxID=2527975 RepID=A0A518B702_9BACT|nr:hypothetical protein Pan216_36270 [Planctomycetes bacterium Pan216]